MTLNGFVCIDKPLGISSFKAVNSIKKLLKVKKIGHAGTLDPQASGLLVVALGHCTRLLPYLVLEPKVYEFAVTFGKTTDTLDCEGELVRDGGAIPGHDALGAVLNNFIGTIEQAPPAYSAIKIDGKRAYALARTGVAVEMKKRPVTINELTLLDYDEATGVALLRVLCGAGTYVRSLSRDIAEALGTFGYASMIRRVKTGAFTLDNPMPLSAGLIDEPKNYITTMAHITGDEQKVVLSSGQIEAIGFGRDIAVESTSQLLFGFEQNSLELLAILRRVGDDNRYHPERVFISQDCQ